MKTSGGIFSHNGFISPHIRFRKKVLPSLLEHYVCRVSS